MHYQAEKMQFVSEHVPFELQKVVQGFAFKYFEVVYITQRADQRVLLFIHVYARENI